MASLARAESGRTAEERANVPEQSLLTLCKRERERERESKQGGLSIDGRADGLPDYLKYYVGVGVVVVAVVGALKAAFQNISASDCLTLLF